MARVGNPPKVEAAGLGGVYGDYVLSVDATLVWADGVVLFVLMASSVLSRGFARRAVHFARIAALFDARVCPAHLDWAGAV